MDKVYVHRFTVSGNGVFPMDMLRYDRCFPRTGDDAGAMQRVIDPELRRNAKKEGIITNVTLLTVNSRRHWQPETGRWASFGWTVLDERTGHVMVETTEFN